MQSAKPDETVPAPKPPTGTNPPPSPVPAPGCRRDQGSSGSGHDRPAASPPAASNRPKPFGCAAGTAPTRICCTTGARAVQQLRVSGEAAAAGSCQVPGDLRRKKGTRSQAPWQAALIRANDCRAPLPWCFINEAINSSRARSAHSGGFAGRGAHREGWGQARESWVGAKPPWRGRRVGCEAAQQARGNSAMCPRVYLAQQPQ